MRIRRAAEEHVRPALPKRRVHSLTAEAPRRRRSPYPRRTCFKEVRKQSQSYTTSLHTCIVYDSEYRFTTFLIRKYGNIDHANYGILQLFSVYLLDLFTSIRSTLIYSVFISNLNCFFNITCKFELTKQNS